MYMLFVIFFFFNDTATTEIYTLSLHDALPISEIVFSVIGVLLGFGITRMDVSVVMTGIGIVGLAGIVIKRSEEHTSELQSQSNLVCRLLLEKKKTNYKQNELDLYEEKLTTSYS